MVVDIVTVHCLKSLKFAALLQLQEIVEQHSQKL